MNTFVVIPVFNEEKTIKQAITQVKKLYQHIIVVDDGSTDNTAAILKEMTGIILCTHIINRGQGAALRTGTKLALHYGADIIVHFDSDLQMQPQEISLLVAPLEKGDYEVVLGSRFLEKKNTIPKVRRCLLFFAFLFNRLVLQIKHLTDPQSGFRALSRKAAETIEITQDRMAHCSEILQEIYKKNLKVKEVPVHIVYTDYSLKKGQRAVNSVKIIWDLVFRKIFW